MGTLHAIPHPHTLRSVPIPTLRLVIVRPHVFVCIVMVLLQFAAVQFAGPFMRTTPLTLSMLCACLRLDLGLNGVLASSPPPPVLKVAIAQRLGSHSASNSIGKMPTNAAHR